MRGTGLAALCALGAVFTLGVTFVLPSGATRAAPRAAAHEASRASRIQRNFFGGDPPKPKPRPQDQDLGPVLNTIKFFQDYSEKGSASIKGPLAGVPWVSLIFLTILGVTLNTFITQGGEGSMYDEMAKKKKTVSGTSVTKVDVQKSMDIRMVKDEIVRE
mmetsp:Transcript_10650/g.28191  ORF Transcript_10650/g.28191 Transcript_10650/m.28191 type:complete len:160 (-) Transcript_10650:304-783(-)